MPTILFTFLFGIFLGFKHALEADHLTAVMTYPASVGTRT
ncbi:MAG: hypothetical protein UV04_C0040G0006 [Candidatus Gottesmanbacteria bacterium GW2011_GWA2_42_16]|nr:MAG: hypothetical protein UV04_C0040G0006 [Candidatus Gottesmanbacteria bacterium GW2011_GWA2_42_16]